MEGRGSFKIGNLLTMYCETGSKEFLQWSNHEDFTNAESGGIDPRNHDKLESICGDRESVLSEFYMTKQKKDESMCD